MVSFTHLPLHRKLTVIIVITTVAAILLASVTTVAYEALHFRQFLVSELETTADVVAANGPASLRFRVPRNAEETLASLAAKERIASACFFTPESELFAAYIRPDVEAVMPPLPLEEGYSFTASHLISVKHIHHDGDFIGSIHLVSDLGGFYDGLKRSVAATALIILTCSTLALVVALRVVRQIARPIDSLIGTANRIAQNHDYSLRARKFADDDLGSLVDERLGIALRRGPIPLPVCLFVLQGDPVLPGPPTVAGEIRRRSRQPLCEGTPIGDSLQRLQSPQECLLRNVGCHVGISREPIGETVDPLLMPLDQLLRSWQRSVARRRDQTGILGEIQPVGLGRIRPACVL